MLYPNLPTKAAQQHLVEGLEPVEPKKRWRRDLPPPVPARDLRIPNDPAAPEVTEEEHAARERVEAEIAANLEGSDWPAEPEAGKERVIFQDSVAGKEYELEFDVEALAAFGALAHARWINNPTDDVDAPEEPALEEPGKEPQAWSNAVDSRVNKGVSTTYPANDVRLRKLGKVNGGCSTYPYTSQTSVGVWWSRPWPSNQCSTPGQYVYANCSPNDWAIILLPDEAYVTGQFVNHPGWLGVSPLTV